MSLITNTKDLKKACTKLKRSKFITVDTEFIRERSYWAQLCLIQVAGAGKDDHFAIDPLAEGIDLTPFYELMQNKKVLKVFHACRQDMEIFYKEMGGKLPSPIFDTQIAAMVCGHGEQISYSTLVASIVKKKLDKSSRFTNWAQRPLTNTQLEYAMSDVTHLRTIYEVLDKELEDKRRRSWIKDEMKTLTSKETYTFDPHDAWKRIKVHSNKPRVLGVLREVAAWREATAQKEDVPRNRILRDDTLAALAMNPPHSIAELAKVRSVPKGFAESSRGKALFDAIQQGFKLSDKDLPRRKAGEALPPGIGPAIEMLKVLLRIASEEHNVAHRLIANVADLEQIAAYKEEAEVEAMTGWRKKIFGDLALEMLNGKLALGMENGQIILLDIADA